MSLIYALIARAGTILAEYSDSTGNFTTVTQSILDNLPDRDAKCTYVYDRYDPRSRSGHVGLHRD